MTSVRIVSASIVPGSRSRHELHHSNAYILALYIKINFTGQNLYDLIFPPVYDILIILCPMVFVLDFLQIARVPNMSEMCSS
jgi:hypothetical protein